MIGLWLPLSRDPVAYLAAEIYCARLRSSRLRHDEIRNQHLTFGLWAQE